MNTFSATKVGTASAITAATAYVLCLAALLLLPRAMTDWVTKNIFHSVVTETPNLTVTGSLVGIVVLSAWAWVVGAVFVVAYSKLTQEKSE